MKRSIREDDEKAKPRRDPRASPSCPASNSQLPQPTGTILIAAKPGFQIAALIDDRKHDDTAAVVIDAAVDPTLSAIQNTAIKRRQRDIIYGVVFLPRFRKRPQKIEVMTGASE